MESPLRFAELRRKLGVTEKVLTQQLRELEAHGVVARRASADVPPKVTYSLTRYGGTLRPILLRMGRWGEAHLERLNDAAPASVAPRAFPPPSDRRAVALQTS